MVIKTKHIGLCLLLCAFTLSSCGGPKGIRPEKEAIMGPLGPYFKVVDRIYKVNDGKVNLVIERIAEGLPEPWKKGMEVGYSNNRVEPGFIVEFLDEEGDVLCKWQSDIVWNDDELDAIVALGVGESASIPSTVSEKNVFSFKVSSTFKYHEPEKPAEPEKEDSESSLSSLSSLYEEAYQEVEKELKDAYDEARDELEEELKDALRELF